MIKLIESIKDVDEVIECLPMVILHLVSLTKYFNWIFNEKKVFQQQIFFFFIFSYL